MWTKGRSRSPRSSSRLLLVGKVLHEQRHMEGVTMRRSALVIRLEKHLALTAAEREALPVLLRGAALRFLLTRLYDLVHGVKGMIGMQKDPLEYRARLRALR